MIRNRRARGLRAFALSAMLLALPALLAAQSAPAAPGFDAAKAQLWFTQAQAGMPVKSISLDKLREWFGAEPRQQGSYFIFETGVTNEFLSVGSGLGQVEIQAIPYFTLRSGSVELAPGMDKSLVLGLLGKPSSSRQGALEYLSWSSVGPNFRLGFDPDGILVNIRL